MTRRIFPCRALALILFLLTAGVATAAFKHVEEGMKVPEVAGRDLVSGQAVSSTDGESSVTLVAFWATWSPRSLELLADLNDMAHRHADRNLRILAVNVEGQTMSRSARQQVDEVLADLEPGYPVVLDPGLELFNEMGVVAVPSLALMDADQLLHFGPSGYSPTVRRELADRLDALLGLDADQPAVGLTQGYRPTRRAGRYYHLAAQLYAQGRLKRALGNLESAVAADAGFSSPHHLRGRILMETGDPQGALAAFTKSAALDSTSVVALAGWGCALLRLNRLDEGIDKLQQALALEESYAPALLGLAEAWARKDDPVKAEGYFRRALALNPRDPEALFRWGRFQRRAGRLDQAVAAYRLAMEQLGY